MCWMADSSFLFRGGGGKKNGQEKDEQEDIWRDYSVVPKGATTHSRTLIPAPNS